MSNTDTNQASELFELCKEVYERTGWEEKLDWDKSESLTFQYFCYEWDDNNYRTGEKWAADNYRIYMASAEEHRINPLYTSDYLLEKLPGSLNDKEGDAYILTVRKVSDSWLANYTFDNVAMWHRYGDTPLLSLLKLTIALSEAGELDNE